MSWRAGARALLGLIAVALVGCKDNSTGPQDSYLAAVHSGSGQFGAPGAMLRDPLEVLVVNAADDVPEEGVTVHWSIVEGSGASLGVSSSVTDSLGIARTQLRLGSALATYRVKAVAESASGAGVTFEARAVAAPQVTSLAPSTPAAGDTFRITGSNFSTTAGDNTVSIGGVPAEVVSATATQLLVRTPACLPTASLSLVVQLGPVASTAKPINVTRKELTPLRLAVGERVAVTDAAALACMRLEMPASADFLLIAQNGSGSSGQSAPFQLVGLAEGALAGVWPEAAGAMVQPANPDPESRIRLMEREIPADAVVKEETGVARMMVAPKVGDRDNFSVLKSDGGFATVTAVVKAVTTHVVIFQDLNAPSGGFTDADFARFGTLFDDPIYPIVAGAYGDPSDIDANGRVVILFTPVVNQWTPRHSSSYFAGFFYGNDLTTRTGSNRAEVFYSFVPDPSAQFGDARSVDLVLRVVPPVLAHELQHMIGFNQRVLKRGAAQEVLWLDEALAHTAEDIVARAFEARGDATTALSFDAGNLQRANEFLSSPVGTSLISQARPGSLEERGEQWIFVRYLMGQFGGTDLLRRLTQTTRTGVDNVVTQTGRGWTELFGDFSVALYADDNPAFAGITLDPRITIDGLNLWDALGNYGYPLTPESISFGSFTRLGSLPAAGTRFYLLAGPRSGTTSFSDLSLAPELGRLLTSDARFRLDILRIR